MRDDLVLGFLHLYQFAKLVWLASLPLANDFGDFVCGSKRLTILWDTE